MTRKERKERKERTGLRIGSNHTIRPDSFLECAFDFVEDVTTPKNLTVVGKIPDYVRGTFFRIGPGGYKMKLDSGKTYMVDHLFDGFSQIHRFEILGPKEVNYSSRHTCDYLLENIRRNGSVVGSYTFAQGKDPCQSYFRKLLSTFTPFFKKTDPHVALRPPVNAGVTITKDYPGLPNSTKDSSTKDSSKSNLYLKTDAHFFQGLDPSTLEPVGVVYQSALHPLLTGPVSSAHARSCPETGDIYNYNLEFGPTPKYRIFRTSPTTQKTEILATITDAKAAYIHSFWLTKNYVILCIFGSHFALGGSKILYTHNCLDAIEPTDEKVNNRFYVIDRTDKKRGVLSTFESEAFFAFHSINAWEEDEDNIILEIPVYKDNSVLKKFYYQSLLGLRQQKEQDVADLKFTRWRLENASGPKHISTKGKRLSILSVKAPLMELPRAVKVWDVPTEDSMELPTLNPDYICREHRYTYGISAEFPYKASCKLVKFDSRTRTSVKWAAQGCLPGEPIFVGDPDGVEEDDGVLLSCVLDMEKKDSFLLVLDARTMGEVCRVVVGGVVNMGFHGMWDDLAKGRIISY